MTVDAPPKYVRVLKTGRVIPMSPYLKQDLADGKLVPYTGPIPVPDEPQETKEAAIAIAAPPAESKPVVTATENANRIFKIIEAVKLSNRDKWTSPKFGRPAMPMVGDISAALGFDVSADEVISALTYMDQE